MTEFEITYLISELSVAANVCFEYWLAATFALAVATFFASEKINNMFLFLISGLYGAFAIGNFLTYVWLMIRISEYVEKIDSLGGDISAFNHPIALISLFVIVAIYIVGSASILFFVKANINRKS